MNSGKTKGNCEMIKENKRMNSYPSIILLYMIVNYKQIEIEQNDTIPN